MRTVGRRLPPGHTPGGFNAYCDICGVLWPRSQLRTDASGSLVCPDEGSGLDEVALAKADARALQRFQHGRPKQTGRPQHPEGELYENPVSIAGAENALGWWRPDAGLRGNASRVQWRNDAPRVEAGDVTAAGAAPSFDRSSGVTFSSSALLRSAGGSIQPRPPAGITMWVVATAGVETADRQDFLRFGMLDSDGELLAGVRLGRFADGTLGTDGEVYAQVLFEPGDDPGTRIVAPRTGTALPYIYSVNVGAGYIILGVNDDYHYRFHYNQGAGTNFTRMLDSVAIGADGDCTIHEAFIGRDVLNYSGAGALSMNAYFRRRWPAIPVKSDVTLNFAGEV